MEHSKAQTALMSKDAELERRAVEVASLQSDKAGLDKLLQVGCAGQLGVTAGQQSSSGVCKPPLSDGGLRVQLRLGCRTFLTGLPACTLPPRCAGEAVGDFGAADAAGGGC